MNEAEINAASGPFHNGRALVINIIGGWDIGIDHLSRVRDNCKKKKERKKNSCAYIEYDFTVIV